MVLALLGAGAQVASPDPVLERWKFETDLGYLRPEGRIDRVFGGGFDAGFTVGHRLFSPVVAEAGIRFGDMSLGSAQTVAGRECVPSRPGGVLCVTGPSTQRGTLTAFSLGLSLPVTANGPGRIFHVGGGGLLATYSVSPSGDTSGSRDGRGYYLTLAVDPLPVGTGRAGLLLRGTRVNAHGASLGTSLAPRTGDTWLDVNLLLRFGPRSTRRP